LDEAFPTPALMPAKPVERAHVRVWGDFDNVKFAPVFYIILLATDGDRTQQLVSPRTDFLQFIESQAFEFGSNGLYWLGKAYSLADIAVYPHFERLVVLEHYHGIGIPNECGRLREWMAAVAERPSVQKTAHTADYHQEAYSKYADGTANGTTAKDMRD
jgi:glutathione S-transferase